MYKAIRSGSHNGYRFTAGKLVHNAPEGALDGCKSVVWIGETKAKEVKTVVPDKAKPLDGTVKQIKKWLDDNGVEYESTARKPELLEILKEA